MSGSVDVVALYRSHFPILLRKCRRMLGDGAAAQDVAQETFTRLWQSRDQVSDPRAVVAWLYTTSTRIAVDRLRSPANRVAEPSRAAEVAGPGPERITAARALLHRVIGALDAPSLELLILSRLDGLTQREIATLVGTSERTVRRRLAELDEHLQAIGADDA
ncbi:MAG: sigma-70 family RNA polymerase sigma factor [Myxococcota bacterium]